MNRYEPTPGDYEASQQSVEELLDWADEKGWPGMRGVLLDANPSPNPNPSLTLPLTPTSTLTPTLTPPLGVLLDGGHSGKTHWSNQLACKVTLIPCTNSKPNPRTLYEP